MSSSPGIGATVPRAGGGAPRGAARKRSGAAAAVSSRPARPRRPGLAHVAPPSEAHAMHPAPKLLRRALVAALTLLLAAGSLQAQDEDEDDLLGGGYGVPGVLPPGLDPTAPKRRQWTAAQLLRWEWSPGLP